MYWADGLVTQEMIELTEMPSGTDARGIKKPHVRLRSRSPPFKGAVLRGHT